MSENTVKPSDIQAVPFFARFLEQQSTQADDDETPQYPPFTYKYPSDWEDR